MNDEEMQGLEGMGALVISVAEDAAQQAKRDIVEHAKKQSLDDNHVALATTAAIVMMMDSLLEASVRFAKKDPKHPLASAPIGLFDTVILPKLAKLREMTGE